MIARSAPRWFGFGLGYSVAEAVALSAATYYGGPPFALVVAHFCNIVFLAIGVVIGVRYLFRFLAAKMARPAGPLGTYAKSDSQGAGGVAGSAQA